MRIILLGPQGSGKTAISQKIAEKYGIPVVKFQNVADELDATAKEDSELGRLAKESIASGSVSDDVCTAVLRKVLGKDDLSGGFLLVDYPKDSGQANAIDEAMNRLKRPVDLVLMIDIDRDELMERRVGRIDCDQCGAHYNLYVNPPMVEGVCDVCGSRVSRRPRGYEENIANRLRDYDLLLGPILEHYKLNGKLRYVDGNGTEEELWKAAQKIIDATPPTVIETEPVEEAAVSMNDRPEEGTGEDKLRGRGKKGKSGKAAKKKDKSKSAGKETEKKKVAAGKTKDEGKKRPTVAKKPTKKKTAAKKTSNKKAASKKKPAAKKKPVSKKKLAAKKKTVSKKKAAVKKKAVSKRKLPSKKKTTVKKALSKKSTAKKAAVRKKKPLNSSRVAKKKVAKKKVVARKKVTAKKKVAAGQASGGKKPATTKKKPVGKKKIGKRKVSKKKEKKSAGKR